MLFISFDFTLSNRSLVRDSRADSILDYLDGTEMDLSTDRNKCAIKKSV